MTNTSQKSDIKFFLNPTITAIHTALELPAGIWLLNEEKKEFRMVCASGLSDDYIRNAVVSEEQAIAVIKEKFEKQKSLIVPDIQTSPFWQRKAEAEAMNLKSAVASTLRIKTQVVGGLVVYIPKDQTPDLEKLAIKIETFAVEITNKLQYVRYVKGLEILNRSAQRINEEMLTSELFVQILKSAVNILNCKHINLFLPEKESNDLVLKETSTPDIQKKNRFKFGEGLVGWVAQAGESLSVPNVTADYRFVKGTGPFSNEKERSMLLSPIKSKDKKVIGVICADALGLNAFDAHDEMLWESFTRQTEIALQNKELYEQIQGQRDSQLQAIGKISDALAGPFDFNKFLRNIWDFAQQLMGKPNLVEIRLLDKTKNELVAEGFHEELIINEKYRRIPMDKGITGWVARHRKSLLISDVSKDSRYIRFLKNTKSELAVPICRNDRLTGVLNIEHPEINAFTDYHQQLAEMIANLAAIAIENADRLTAAYDISKAAYEFRNLDNLYPEIQKIISRLMNADNFYILRYDAIQEKLKLAYWTDERDKDLPLDEILKKGLIGYVIRKGQPLLCPPEKFEELEKQGEVERSGTRSNYRYWLGVPLKTNGNTIGVLAVKTYDDNIKYTETDEEILMFVSEQIAMAIERVRTQEELEASKRDLEKRVEEISSLNKQQSLLIENTDRLNTQQKALIDLAQRLTSSIQMKQEDILRFIYANASAIMDTGNMFIGLYDKATDYVHFPLAYKNGDPTHIPARTSGGGRSEYIIKTKEPMLCKTQKEADEWYKLPGHQEYMKDPLASFIGVPMMVKDEVIGVVATYHPEKDNLYTENDLEILQAMANIAAIALENARLYSEIVQKSDELQIKTDELQMKTDELRKKTESLKSASYLIAETQDKLTRTLFAADIVHRLNNLVGTIPIWTNSIKDKIKEMTIAIQNDMDEMIEKSVRGITKSHETDFIYRLNNIVGTIPIWTDLLKKETEKGSTAILDDVNNLLGEVERLKNPPEKERVDINAILKSILNHLYIHYRKEIKNGDFIIMKEIHTELHKVCGIYPSVYDAIFNVISNAIESMPEKKGTLGIKADNCKDDRHSDCVRIEISDTGNGIPDGMRDKIFESFFSTKGTGRGYGLWRTKAIIENLGGIITVDSQYGHGATFTILLPKTKENQNDF
ncbi:MAG: GAF domain-containing protein [Desulfococcaceae bacterium]|jgi:GAF domain-containing protein|nr:GAF domain-containing protein [Desulfococcaceae bacterium]